MKKKKIFLWLPMVLFVLVLAGGIWSGTVPVRGLREVLSVSAHLGEILANGKKQRQLPIYSVETKDAVVALTFDCAGERRIWMRCCGCWGSMGRRPPFL